MGGTSAEREISIQTGSGVMRALQELGYDAQSLDYDTRFIDGIREIEPDLLDLVRSLHGSKWQLFTKIQLPGALPYIFSGMKVGAILAVAGAIVGEFIASERGLGYLMIQVQSSLDTPAMVMAVVLLTLLGVALYGLVLALERIFVVGDARQT